MRIDGVAFTTIWPGADATSVSIIDQTRLPHRFEILEIADVAAAARVHQGHAGARGAADRRHGRLWPRPGDARRPLGRQSERASAALAATRPTAVNLQWAIAAMTQLLAPLPPPARFKAAFDRAGAIAREDVALCEAIGVHGLGLIAAVAARKPVGRPRSIFSPIATRAGWRRSIGAPRRRRSTRRMTRRFNVHVFVDETRPRNQGAALTAWELGQHGVPHTVIVGQRRRPSDAAWRDRSRHRRHRPHHRARATSATRSAPI